jgi:hypothetical protein
MGNPEKPCKTLKSGTRRVDSTAMATTEHPHPADSERRAQSRLTALLARTLSMLILLCALYSTIAISSTTIARANSMCLPSNMNHSVCSSFQKIVPAADGEAQEDEEELEEGEEVGAPTEVKAEEAGSGANPPSNATTGSQSSSSGPSPASARGVAIVSRLKLTARTTASLKRRTSKASTVEFSFVLSAPATVKVTLVRQTHSTNRKWVMLPDSLSLNAPKGQVASKLHAHNLLPPGRYRLTVKPLDGAPSSIYLNASR